MVFGDLGAHVSGVNIGAEIRVKFEKRRLLGLRQSAMVRLPQHHKFDG